MSSTLVAPTSAFGLQLLQQELKSHKGQNVLVSPASVSLALAMTMNGARGKTQKDMSTTLALPFGDADTTNSAYASLLSALSDNKALGVELALANAIWANEQVEFRPQFLATNQKSFRARVETANFSAPQTLTDINQWVSDGTNKRITKILNEISPDKIMFLLNTTFFKGNWNVKFDKKLTQTGAFHATTGTKQHPLMTRTGDMFHFGSQKYQAIRLPFGESKRISLLVFLPNADSSVEELVKELTVEDLNRVGQLTWESDGTLVLPRFELEYDVDLKETLQALGMADAFEKGTADFSGMADGDIYISEVKHKTFAKFDEEGGEAAAATSVGMSLECVHYPFDMRCDRPFVIALYDGETSTTLFNGVVNDPK